MSIPEIFPCCKRINVYMLLLLRQPRIYNFICNLRRPIVFPLYFCCVVPRSPEEIWKISLFFPKMRIEIRRIQMGYVSNALTMCLLKCHFKYVFILKCCHDLCAMWQIMHCGHLQYLYQHMTKFISVCFTKKFGQISYIF